MVGCAQTLRANIEAEQNPTATARQSLAGARHGLAWRIQREFSREQIGAAMPKCRPDSAKQRLK
jgi:hypothetical protein